MTRLPNWKIIQSLGDVDYVAHGGTLVYEDANKDYPAQAEVIVPGESGCTVYRFILDRCTFIDGVLSDNKYHPESPAWFADGLKDVCETHDADLDETIQNLCSEDPVARAVAYQMVGEFYGWENFDSYPLTLAKKEVKARYG